MGFLEYESYERKVANIELLRASYYGDITKVREIIKGDVDVNIKDVYGNTPLINASNKGLSEIVHILLEHPKIDVNASNLYGINALHEACRKGHERITYLLIIQPGTNYNAVTNDGDYPIFFAAEGGHAKCVEMLLSRGAEHSEMGDNMFKKPGIADAMIKGFRKMSERCSGFIEYLVDNSEFPTSDCGNK